MRQLFIDLDGVLADFDAHYRQLFGELPDRNAPAPPWFWENVTTHGSFFRDLPLMPDARHLWEGACKLHPQPIILTGAPPEVPEAGDQKRAWVREHIGPAVVITCESAHKRLHGKPGDILIDDWVKYRDLWTEMGGIFILHTNAFDSLARAQMYFHFGG